MVFYSLGMCNILRFLMCVSGLTLLDVHCPLYTVGAVIMCYHVLCVLICSCVCTLSPRQISIRSIKVILSYLGTVILNKGGQKQLRAGFCRFLFFLGDFQKE